MFPVLCLHEYHLFSCKVLSGNGFNFQRGRLKQDIGRKLRIYGKDVVEVWSHSIGEIELVFIDVFDSFVEGELNLADKAAVRPACGS